MKLPNLFDHATSELSQDAFILWLLQWADPKFAEADPSLHNTAQNFVRLLLGDDDLEISSIIYDKQKFHIDVYAIVNNKYFILIEDKTNTSQHHKQMTKYSQEVESKKEFCDLQKYCVYFKTGNERQEDIETIRKDYEANNANWHFTVIQRQQFLEVLNPYDGGNAIICDYRERLGNLEADFMSYKTILIKDWTWGAWQGFYTDLARKIPNMWWGTVNPPSGAFVCAAWSKKQMTNGCFLKLQIEGHHKAQSRLCIKIEMPIISQKERLSILRRYGQEIINTSKKRDLLLDYPKRYSSKGAVLTLACVDIEKVIDENYDIEIILSCLKKYEMLLDDFISKHNPN